MICEAIQGCGKMLQEKCKVVEMSSGAFPCHLLVRFLCYVPLTMWQTVT